MTNDEFKTLYNMKLQKLKVKEKNVMIIFVLGVLLRILEGAKFTGLSICIILLATVGYVKNYYEAKTFKPSIPWQLFVLKTMVAVGCLLPAISLIWCQIEIKLYGVADECWGDTLIAFAVANMIMDSICIRIGKKELL